VDRHGLFVLLWFQHSLVSWKLQSLTWLRGKIFEVCVWFDFASVLRHCWLDDRNNSRPVKTCAAYLKGSLTDKWRKTNRSPTCPEISKLSWNLSQLAIMPWYWPFLCHNVAVCCFSCGIALSVLSDLIIWIRLLSLCFAYLQFCLSRFTFKSMLFVCVEPLETESILNLLKTWSEKFQVFLLPGPLQLRF